MVFAACGTQPVVLSGQHIQQSAESPASVIPQTLKHSFVLPPPKPAVRAETYSVVVTNVPAQEILFALARDAKINLDIHPGIQGSVTLNALNQTLPQILTRIARQIDMRHELENGNLTVMPDTPYLHNYKIDYVNMTRDSTASISNSTKMEGVIMGSAGSAPSGSLGNDSSISIKNSSKNNFWETLVRNIKDILHETDKILPEGSSETIVQQASTASSTGTGAQAANKKSAARNTLVDSPNPISVQEGGTTVTRLNTFREAASVIANPEVGLIIVRATGKQHEKIQEFIDKVMVSARRQVLIEATIVEVRLNDQYKQGINWAALRLGTRGISLTQLGTAGLPSVNPLNLFTLDYANPTARGNLSAQVSLLESFGTVKVLSSPKISVMNNQTAMLRVVDNLVYFNVKSETTACSPAPCTPITHYTATANTIPVGFTMSVTPQINDSDTVLLNLRPSITRLLSPAQDPTPGLAINNLIPQVSIREMESVLKIENNQIAVLGGLMQDEANNLTDAVPGVSGIPLAGELFKHRNDTTTKTELVIFLRPAVIKEASIAGDFSAYRDMLPDRDFFREPAIGRP